MCPISKITGHRISGKPKIYPTHLVYQRASVHSHSSQSILQESSTSTFSPAENSQALRVSHRGEFSFSIINHDWGAFHLQIYAPGFSAVYLGLGVCKAPRGTNEISKLYLLLLLSTSRTWFTVRALWLLFKSSHAEISSVMATEVLGCTC